MKRVLFLTDNFYPELNAPATRTLEHCKVWVKKGYDVTVITGAPNFPKGKVFKGYKNKIFQKEKIEGINVIRVWTYITANEGFLKRVFDYLSFMISSFFVGIFLKTDIIIATSPQFFTAISGRWLGFWKRKKWVMEVRDIWPESIKTVGVMKDGVAIRFFEFLEKRMYKSAHKIIVVTNSIKDYIVKEHSIDSEKIEVIRNGVNKEFFYPTPKKERLLKELGVEKKIIVSYIGTHGMAHALDFILKSIKEVSEDYHFLFIGEGAEKDRLIQLKNELKLRNVTMIGMQPKNKIRDYISISDISLVNLKKSDTFKGAIPSKIFENAAMYKPILLGLEGEAKDIIERYGIGVSFTPENKIAFLKQLDYLSEKKIKKEGFDKFIEDFDRTNLAIKMINFITI